MPAGLAGYGNGLGQLGLDRVHAATPQAVQVGSWGAPVQFRPVLGMGVLSQSKFNLLDESTCRYRGEDVSLDTGLQTLARIWARQRTEDRAVYWIGNGGSAALVSHLSQDLLNTYGVRSLTFNDPALITCMANDYGYRDVFARPLRVVARECNVLMAISSFGMSDNVIGAAETALENGLDLITCSAFAEDNRLQTLPATLAFHTPTENYGLAELTHGALLHAAIDGLAGESPARRS